MTHPPRPKPETAELRPCPFCDKPLRVGSRKINPHARCVTEDCYGAKMPVVNLDDPRSVAAWNTRAGACAQEAPEPSDGCFEMLWAWFEKRRDDMGWERDGLSADDFRQMLDEHEANLTSPQKVKISGEMIEAAAKAIVSASFADDETPPWEAYEPHARAALKAAFEAALHHQMTPTEIEAQRQSWVRGMTARCEHGVVDFEQCPQCRRSQEASEKGEA
jgi:hypothetical protein